MSGNRTANTPTRVTIIMEEGDEVRALVVPEADKAHFEVHEYDEGDWTCPLTLRPKVVMPYFKTTIEAEIHVGEGYEIHTGRDQVAGLVRHLAAPYAGRPDFPAERKP